MNNVQLKFYCPNVPSYCCLGRTHHSKSLDSQWPHINPTPYWFPLESKFYPFFFLIYFFIFLQGRYWTCKKGRGKLSDWDLYASIKSAWLWLLKSSLDCFRSHIQKRQFEVLPLRERLQSICWLLHTESSKLSLIVILACLFVVLFKMKLVLLASY